VERIDMHRLQELVRLHRMGTGAREVARLLGMSPNTERQYRTALESAGALAGDVDALPPLDELRAAVQQALPVRPIPQQQSTLAAWTGTVDQLIDQGGTPTAIFDRLRLEHPDFAGSLSAVKRLCARIQRERGPSPDDVAIAVETAPGEVAQVDFGYVGMLVDPATNRARKAWVFVMVLGWSRHMVARLVFDQSAETWIRCHVEAFAELDGVPAVIVPDNLKAAVIRAAFGAGDPSVLNRSYREVARHYGFKVDPTPAYSPQKKGKVESAVKYVKGNFVATLTERRLDLAQAALTAWTREIAGRRVHGTTLRPPLERFLEIERATLLPLPSVAFEPITWSNPTVGHDHHVWVEAALYSVPWRFADKEVFARATPGSVAIFHDDVRIATHDRAAPGERRTIEEHLPEHRRDLRHRGQAYWEERADRIGDEVGAWVREVFASDDVLSQLRVVQQAVPFLETLPPERARGACVRARFFASYSVGALKTLIRKGLDRVPPPSCVLPTGALDTPRFARDVRELIAHIPEDHDASH
jgi:transposase